MKKDEQEPRVIAAQAVLSPAGTIPQSLSMAGRPRHSKGIDQGCPENPARSSSRPG